jgi:hypothetical protein
VTHGISTSINKENRVGSYNLSSKKADLYRYSIRGNKTDYRKDNKVLNANLEKESYIYYKASPKKGYRTLLKADNLLKIKGSN